MRLHDVQASMIALFEINDVKFIQENITMLVCKTCTKIWTNKWTSNFSAPKMEKRKTSKWVFVLPEGPANLVYDHQ
jgi:hypothetical protein